MPVLNLVSCLASPMAVPHTTYRGYRGAFAFVDYCFSFGGYGLSLDSPIKVNEMQKKHQQCPLLWPIELKVTNGGKMDLFFI